MSLKDKEKWNRNYGDSKHVSERTPCEWMTDNVDLLTGTGHALDIAAGTGRNAVYAASLGYDVVGIDISEEGIKKIRAQAKEKNVNVSTIVADLDNYKLEENSFDLILCFYFLNRSLFKEIERAVKPGGLVIFETFTIDHLKY